MRLLGPHNIINMVKKLMLFPFLSVLEWKTQRLLWINVTSTITIKKNTLNFFQPSIYPMNLAIQKASYWDIAEEYQDLGEDF